MLFFNSFQILYHVFQLIAFTTMAVIIMRLKLFWTPHLCLMTSLLASQKVSSISPTILYSNKVKCIYLCQNSSIYVVCIYVGYISVLWLDRAFLSPSVCDRPGDGGDECAGLLQSQPPVVHHGRILQLPTGATH